MLATRVIPTLLQRGATLVKGVRFESWRSVGHVRQAVRVHNSRQVDELIYLDIGATPEGRGPDFALVESFARDCFMPLTVGGGVRSVKDVEQLLAIGADKVAICTALAECYGLLQACADRYGSQCITAAIDVKAHLAMIKCGRAPAGSDAYSWAERCERDGAGEILLTSIERDGTLEGYDLESIRAVSEAVSIPVIANGGAGTYEHMREAIEAGAHAVAAGALFQFTDATPREASQYLLEHGIHARVA